MDRYRVWKQLGGFDVGSLEAKAADALVVLEEAWKKENQNGETNKERLELE